ncbi:MAG: c-type cytochrome biogenesis protein CcmI, partial [Gammaproteobacteria bacterium]|nr:c-type cytochrome biogenesis protein CcmI [Gammaproteobacteria bacterium]
TTFTIIAAVMILLALAMLAPALLRKRQMAVSDRDQQNVIIARERLEEMELELASGKISQEEFGQAKIELEQALLQDLEQEDGPDQISTGSGRLTLAAIAVVVPVLAITMYMFLGTPAMVEFDASKQAAQQGKEMPSVEEMLASIKRRLKEKPDDAEGWFLLGRTYMVLEQHSNAAKAFEQLLKLSGEESTVMLALADAVTMVQGGSMQGRPAELINKSLKLAPESQTALWMGGLMESQKGNFAQAITYWKRLESMLGDEPEALQRVRSMISKVEGMATAAGK